MQAAEVHARNKILWITALSRTEEELWTPDGPVAAMLDSVDTSEKGNVVLSALERSGVVRDPGSWDTPTTILLASGAKTWRAFEKNAKMVLIERDTKIAVTPTKQQTPGSGYLYNTEKTFYLPTSASPAELGRAVEQALELCE